MTEDTIIYILTDGPDPENKLQSYRGALKTQGFSYQEGSLEQLRDLDQRGWGKYEVLCPTKEMCVRVAQAIESWERRNGEFRTHYEENGESIVELIQKRDEIMETDNLSGEFRY